MAPEDKPRRVAIPPDPQTRRYSVPAPRKPAYIRKGRIVRCPICGHEATFGLIVAMLRVQFYRQVAAGRWKRLRGYPAKYDTHSTITMICAQCAYPMGQPPACLVAQALKPTVSGSR